MNDFRRRPGEINDHLRQLSDRTLARVPEINRTDEVALALHQSNESVDKIVYVAKGPRLAAIAEDSGVLILWRLNVEVRDHAAVVWVHSRSISIANSRDLNRQAM